ncbi:LPS export ABC transporter periplasmic protein LptC [Marinomonas sp. THO17]|uniref:LPS export ABC transporter periplasmic protein LptC n=1 Tax=Marinomonas sp. THO17 TaxID=3149048 RepID=UPI00336C1102
MLIWYKNLPHTNLVESESLSSTPDYFITQVVALRYDAQGNLIERINAEQTLHYIQTSRTLLENPNIDRYSISGSWHAHASQGTIEDGSNDILLSRNAEAVKKYKQSEDVILHADTIHYLDQDKSLTSQGDAILISSQGKTSAGKIITYINSEEVVMTGSVRGNYETTH